MAGLTPTGLVIDRYPEILSSIEQSERELVDPNIYTRDDELLGRLNKTISERLASVYELIEYVNDSFNIQKAEGKQLDDLAALRDVRRLAATKSNGRQVFVGTPGVMIPTGVLLEGPSLNRFQTTLPLQLNPNLCLSSTIEIANVVIAELYTVFINNLSFTYTPVIGDTAEDIIDSLSGLINASPVGQFTSEIIGSSLKISSINNNPIAVMLGTTNIKIVEVSAVVITEAVNSGPISVPSFSVTKLITPVAGVTSTYNPDVYNLGRLEETDEELRLRIPLISSTGSTGTVPSIEGAILANVQGVISARVIENTGSVPDAAGRPSHSYETVVVGGTDQNVGKEVWRTKPAGIPAVGNTTEIIYDSNNNPRLVSFTRPVPIYVAYRVTYTLYDEEAFPPAGESIIRSVVAEVGSDFGLGVDAIPSRMIGPIHSSVGGIDEVTVEVQVLENSGDTPDDNLWQPERIDVPETQFASTEPIDVVVVRVV